MLVGALALLSACGYALLHPTADLRGSLLLKLVSGLAFAAACVAAFVSARNFVWPPVLFAATDRGIVVHFEGATRLRPELFISWERVKGMEYVAQKGIGRGGDMAIIKTIALQVCGDDDWSPAERLRRNYDEARGLVHLDAFTGTPHGRELLRQLEAIRARHIR